MMQQSNTASDHHPAYIGSNEASRILPWTATSVHRPTHDHDPFPFHPPQPAPYGSAALFDRRLQLGYELGTSSSTNSRLRFVSESLASQVVRPNYSAPFGLQAELQRMTAQEIMDAKALAASKSHSEAERRRRERINNNLSKLRSLLPNTTKTDKASLLAEVVQHVKELKRQTTLIAETSSIPTETDELTVDNCASDEEYYGKAVIKASICCDDRVDLLQDLIKTLKLLKLKTLKAEITTLGGRVKNVLFIAGDDDHKDADMNFEDAKEQQLHHHHHHQRQQLCISSIEEALKAVMEKSNGDDSCVGNVKRQRTSNLSVL